MNKRPNELISHLCEDSSPLVSYILICYNQQNTIEEALSSALAQTYKSIELIISDDCSTDATVEIIKLFMNGRPTKYKLNVNEKNLGIGGNLSKAISLSSGEFIVPAAGDDISIPDRVELVVNHWLQSGKKIGYINSDLIEIDQKGNEISYMKSDNFTSYPDIEAWLKKPQFHVGAEAWSKKFWNKFTPLINISAEDQVLAFRAIILGAGSTLHHPTVRHRIGGISMTKINTVDEKINKLNNDAKTSIFDLKQILDDAKLCSLDCKISSFVTEKIREAELTISVFNRGQESIISQLFNAKSVKIGKRFRLLSYILFPSLISAIYSLKKFKKNN